MAFVDTEKRSAGEVQQKVGRLKLSEVVRMTSRLNIKEEWMNCNVCTMGQVCKIIGIPTGGDQRDRLSNYFNIDYEIVREAEMMARPFREYANKTPDEIADWLAAQGL